MTKTLELAIERLRQVPEDRQDTLARLLLHELDEDERSRLAASTFARMGAGLLA